MYVYLRTIFQFSGIIPTSFRQGGDNFIPSPTSQPLKNPPRLALNYDFLV